MEGFSYCLCEIYLLLTTFQKGSIQEEIRFMINTELIVSLLFTARLEDKESVVMKGAERFSKYSGYSHTFEWKGEHQDDTPRFLFHSSALLVLMLCKTKGTKKEGCKRRSLQ